MWNINTDNNFNMPTVSWAIFHAFLRKVFAECIGMLRILTLWFNRADEEDLFNQALMFSLLSPPYTFDSHFLDDHDNDPSWHSGQIIWIFRQPPSHTTITEPVSLRTHTDNSTCQWEYREASSSKNAQTMQGWRLKVLWAWAVHVPTRQWETFLQMCPPLCWRSLYVDQICWTFPNYLHARRVD